jgi:DNA replication protein DnaC
MLTDEITACCKALRLSRNIAEMSERVHAASHQEYLLQLLQSELKHREAARKEKLLKNAGFYSIKAFENFRFDDVTLPAGVTPEYLKNGEFLNTKTNLVM